MDPNSNDNAFIKTWATGYEDNSKLRKKICQLISNCIQISLFVNITEIGWLKAVD